MKSRDLNPQPLYHALPLLCSSTKFLTVETPPEVFFDKISCYEIDKSKTNISTELIWYTDLFESLNEILIRQEKTLIIVSRISLLEEVLKKLPEDVIVIHGELKISIQSKYALKTF